MYASLNLNKIGEHPPEVHQVLRVDKWGRMILESIKSKRDFSESNSIGSRGVAYHYLLPQGIFRCFEMQSWKSYRVFFVSSAYGEIHEISREEVIAACQNLNSDSGSTC